MDKKIGFIGAGNMGSAMINGLLCMQTVHSNQIYFSDRNKETLEIMANRWSGINSTDDNLHIAKNVDIIILAVKPHMYKTVIEEIAPEVDESKIIMTIAAGVDIKKIEELFVKETKIVRTMPNTPALIGEGVTAYCCNKNIKEDDENSILTILNSFGIVEKVVENYFDAVTAVSGSSPACVFMFLEAMADAAVLHGLQREQAYRMVSQSVAGAAKMVLETGKHPAVLKDAVCSPGGTAIEAVVKLEESGMRSAIISAMTACAKKAKKMTK